MSEGADWILSEIADLALTNPVRALAFVAPPARCLDGAYMRWAGDLLERAARRLRDEAFDLHAFSRVVDDVARNVRFSRGTIEALRKGDAPLALPKIWRRSGLQPLARFRPYLVEVAARYTRLRKVGKRFVGRCPLHEDSTPSFVCYPDGRFFCFGCFQWGDAVDLVSRREALSIGEAAARLVQEFEGRDGASAVLRQGKKAPLPRPAAAHAGAASYGMR